MRIVGYDTSYHAVDMRLIEQRVLPYLSGAGGDRDLDDLVGFAAEQTKVRFRAKAWALGALEAAGFDSGFEGQLYVWGRPFLITAQAPEDVADWVIRYTQCSAANVDELARTALHQWDPALARVTQPDLSGGLPPDEQLGTMVSWKIRLLRDAASALRTGKTEVLHPFENEMHDAADILTGNLQFALLEFVSRLLPGWMDRGRVWRTALTIEAEMGYPPGFGSNSPLLGALPQIFPHLDWDYDPTITANYMVGGYVAPTAITTTRTILRANHTHLAHTYDEPADTALSLRKWDEAFALAERIGGGFAEATEIYSGMEGKMN